MDLFHRARLVRLRSHLDKYLMAEDDQENVCQDRRGASYNARWAVELVEGPHPLVRLKSRHDLYLTASNEPFLLGCAGRKVIQTAPTRLDSSVEWEPIREGFQVMLKTRDGRFLQANGGLPPWRNSVSHYPPHCSIAPTWILWDVHILDITTPSPSTSPSVALDLPPEPDRCSQSSRPSDVSLRLSKIESSSFWGSLHKVEGRTIHYTVADDDGNLDESFERSSFIFNKLGVKQLTQKLEEETNLRDIIVCHRNSLNGRLYPLHLTLPPNNAAMHVVVVRASSRGIALHMIELTYDLV
ncbi:uncharacterized protein LOC103721972 isoform X2 [Phoenix dactylifera]|uniref:Uncharacterized protein LOC103721972 isoform X2 n=1 Tax=Phoenix dactylifera TaxID=42345 RepID=A0A8B9AXV1_PHODC|nr:uncharacterized protein LOC103721972 isoform X2 [Phoenix dactylifera]